MYPSIIQKLICPADLLAHTRLILPRAERVLQMAARVERLGPDVLLHIPSESRHHLLRVAPHPLTPEFVVENVVHGRRVQLIRVGVQE